MSTLANNVIVVITYNERIHEVHIFYQVESFHGIPNLGSYTMTCVPLDAYTYLVDYL
jgi:hypothetical protein